MVRGIQIKSLVLCGLLLFGAVAAGAAEPAVSDLVRAAQAGDESARVKAIDQLGAQGAKAAAAVEPLTQLLGDGSAKVRAHAVRSLGLIGSPAKTSAAAIAALMNDNDETVRRQAVTALTTIRPGPQVMVPLVVQLLEESDPGVQMRILHAISEAGVEAIPGLIEGLKNDKAAYWACLILREIGPAAKEAVPALAERLKDPRPQVRREAALTLGAMQEAAVPVLPQIAAGLDDEHVRAAATFALGQIGQIPPGAEAKIQANAKSDDAMLNTVSSWTLARAHPADKALHREAAQRLIARVGDPDPYVREFADRALAGLPPAPEIMAPLWEKFLETANETTLRYVLDDMAALGPSVVPRLAELLKHKNLRANVLFVLGRIGPGAAPATDAVAKLLTDEDTQVATEAALTIADIGPGAKGAVGALTAALQKEDCPDAHAIIYALGSIGPGAAAAEPKLVALLKNQDHSLAAMSAWALSQVHPKSQQIAAQAIPVLLAGLADPLPESRQEAAEALGSFGPLAKDALSALQKASQDESQSVRDAAATAIRSIRGEAAK